MSKKRKYSEDYVQYGFTFITEKGGTQRPKCFLCDKLMCSDNMKPSKLKEHFNAVHHNSSDSMAYCSQLLGYVRLKKNTFFCFLFLLKAFFRYATRTGVKEDVFPVRASLGYHKGSRPQECTTNQKIVLKSCGL